MPKKNQCCGFLEGDPLLVDSHNPEGHPLLSTSKKNIKQLREMTELPDPRYEVSQPLSSFGVEPLYTCLFFHMRIHGDQRPTFWGRGKRCQTCFELLVGGVGGGYLVLGTAI